MNPRLRGGARREKCVDGFRMTEGKSNRYECNPGRGGGGEEEKVVEAAEVVIVVV